MENQPPLDKSNEIVTVDGPTAAELLGSRALRQLQAHEAGQTSEMVEYGNGRRLKVGNTIFIPFRSNKEPNADQSEY